MKVYDISMRIHHDMPVYKNKKEKKPRITVARDFSSGSTYETRIQMDMHTGTHIDAPLHIFQNGPTVGEFDLNRLVTRCKVISLTHLSDKITENDLHNKNIQNRDFILLKTKNSFIDHFDFEFVYLDRGGARFLCEAGVWGVGIDSLGIERNQPGHETHKILLGAGVVILEGLRLKDIKEGEYFLCALPLKIHGVEAAPVRAVLVV